MYDRNGMWREPLQIPKPAVWSRRVNAVRRKLADWPPPVKIACALTLLVLLTLCAGCATPSTPPNSAARVPAPPRLSEPLPSESYSQKAQRLIESWRASVTGM